MLLKLTVERREKEKLVNDIAGDRFTFFEQLQNKVFGSPKYDIIIAEPDIFKGKSPGRICANFEIRKKGLVAYFRFNHDEYAIATNFHQLTIVKAQNLVIQFNTHRISFKITNTNNHLKFLRNLINQKAEFCMTSTNIEMN